MSVGISITLLSAGDPNPRKGNIVSMVLLPCTVVGFNQVIGVVIVPVIG